MLFFHDMAGVFYAVIFGLVLSLFTLLGELTWVARKDKKHDQVDLICYNTLSKEILCLEMLIVFVHVHYHLRYF